MRSVGVLTSVARVADRLFQLHPLPVRVQFIGQNEGDGSAAAGAHLGPVCYKMYGSVGVNSNKHAGVQDGTIRMTRGQRLVCPQRFRNQAHAQDQGASGNYAL